MPQKLILMFTNAIKNIREYTNTRPRTKKVIGVLLILVGLAALVTPLTPGSWLALIGLELLGIRILFIDSLRRRFGDASKLIFWKKMFPFRRARE